EKGIDYKGDLGQFRASFAQHAAIARTLGPYKLSLHSGSDKFSVYPIAAELAGGLVHLKTAGTSYLEALRVVARKDPALFRRILDFAFERFDTDKASYHISAELTAIPRSTQLKDSELEASILNDNHGRQLLHVTFGSVLTTKGADGRYLFRDALYACLLDHEDEHYAVLKEHLGRHVGPFGRRA
ncbi:MAG TPA: tagaturonate epimerase family protein, partial [Phycisphaerae bacterium]|nr:tagaturonate epimerase family protein [Phycisphaerae bacterium]